MALDPNQIDISLSLLPGESEQVMKDFINQLSAISGYMAALTDGEDFAPVDGVMPRISPTSSTKGVNPVDVNIVSVSPTASIAFDTEVSQDQEVAETRTRNKLGAIVNPETPTEKMDYASVPPGQEEEAPEENLKDSEDGFFRNKIAQAKEELRLSSLIKRADNALLVRNEPTETQAEGGKPGSVNWRESIDEARNLAMTYGIFQHGRGGVGNEVEQLKSSLRPDNIEHLGTELGGEQAPSTNVFGIEGVIPGMPLFQAIKGMLGSDSAKESAGYKGAGAEVDALWKGVKNPYLTQNEARHITHNAADKGWNAEVAERDLGNFSKLRDTTPGLRQMDTSAYGEIMEQTRRGGGSSLDDVNRALKAMPAAAHAAHMGINEYIKSASEYAESLTQSGASFGKSMMAAPSWTAATGMAPQVAAAVRQSPMVQGRLYAQGYTPATEGLASSGQVAKATGQSVKELHDIYQGTFQPIEDTTESGTKIITTPEEQVRAQIGADLSINADQVEKLLAQEKLIGSRADTASDIDAYQTKSQEIEKKYADDPEKLKEAREAMASGTAPEEYATRPEIIEQLRASGVNENRINEVAKEKDPIKFAEQARANLTETTEEMNDDSVEDDESINERMKVSVDIKLKGAAEKLFENPEVDTYREGKKKTNAGRGNFNYNNPLSKTPKKSWIDHISQLGG